MTPEKERLFKRSDEEVSQNFSQAFCRYGQNRRGKRPVERIFKIGRRADGKRLSADEKSQRSDDVSGHNFGGHGFDSGFMFIYVVPTLVATFKELNVDLPLSTQAIIFISDSITKHTYLFIIFFLAVVFFASWFLRTEKGKIFLGNVFLKTPLISPIVKKINSARTSRTLASLISSGVNVVEALTITREVLQNKKYKEVLTIAIDDVQKGVPVSISFKGG